jgi:ABC-type molybdate transport system substrate-binding protein
MPTALPWPLDPSGAQDAVRLDIPASNLVLDLHGSVQSPQLVLFMAGNQFRALPDLLAAFRATPPGAAVARVFYATLPPGRLLDAMAAGRLHCGNLVVDLGPGALWPDVFMAGPRELQRLRTAGHVGDATHYASNRGSVLLVRAGNPCRVQGVKDLLRDDVRVAISSPEREPASFESYRATIDAQGGAGHAAAVLAKATTVSPSYVHHREVPQLLADDVADVAPIFRHLADYLVTQMPGHFAQVPLPPEGNNIDELWAAPVLAAPHAPAAKAWCGFLHGDEAQALLRTHGLSA